MTTNEKAMKTLRNLTTQIREARKAIAEAVAAGVTTATISVGGGTRSYSRISLGELRAHLADLCEQRRKLKMRICGVASGITHVVTIRS